MYFQLKQLKKSSFIRNLWTLYKAKQQEYRIQKEQVHYEKLAKEKGIKILNESQVQKELINSLKQCRISARSSKIGQLRIVYASKMSNWETYQIPPALRKFGEVLIYNPRKRGFSFTNNDCAKQRALLSSNLFNYIKKENEKKPIDIFISYLSGWNLEPNIIDFIGNLGIIAASFHWDDRLGFRGRYVGDQWSGPAALVASYDICLTNSPSSLIKYFVEGGLAIFWPEAANPSHFRPLSRSFEYDVSFVGGCYGPRPSYINYLRNKGISVETFGPNWPNGKVTKDEMVEIYAKSRINLGFSGIGYSMKETCLKGRDFEVPMSGALYFTTEHPDLHLVYEVGREIVTYRSKREMLSKVLYLLNHPDECERIRQAARQRCLRDHSWERRFRNLFGLIGLIKD